MRRKRGFSPFVRFLMGLLVIVLLALGAGTALTAVWMSQITAGLPDVSTLPDLLSPSGEGVFQPTRLYDRTGQHLLYTLENPGLTRRTLSIDPARPDHLSPEVIRVAIPLLDATFWENPGFDASNLLDPYPQTIAERLVLNLLLDREQPDSRRALRMRLLAAQVVSRYGRRQVLEWYLNSAPFGHLTYGIESAARLYLDKSASELNLAEAALLIPLLNTPALNPLDAPAAAKENQQAALDVLLEKNILTPEEHQRARSTPLRLRESFPESRSVAGAFTTLVLDQVAARLGRQRLERGGLRIITTLDLTLQQELQCSVQAHLAQIQGQSYQAVLPDGSPCQMSRLLPTRPPVERASEALTASALVMNPQTAQILAFVGDTSRAGEAAYLSVHPAGTLLPPFALVTAFARAYSPATMVWDLPQDLSLPNLDGTFHGPIRLRTALANDYAGALSRVLQPMGGEVLWQLAQALGLEDLNFGSRSGASWESARFSLPQLAQAYALFPNMGTVYGVQMEDYRPLQPVTVLYVEDGQGNVLLDLTQPQSRTLVSAPIAYLMHHVLSDEPARWQTLGYPNPLEIGRPAGAKIGRASRGKDLWAVGYTRDHLAVVWMGESTPESQSPSLRVADVAALWHAAMQYVSRDLPPRDWEVPAGVSTVQVCEPSGLLPTSACPQVVSEVFLTGNEPVAYDTLYQVVQINRETGRRATVFTPPSLVDEKVYMNLPPEALEWAQSQGIEIPPEKYDAIQMPLMPENAQMTHPAPFAMVHGEVIIRGTAGGAGFTFYQLQAGEGLNPQSWIEIASGDQPVKNGVLGKWNTTGLEGLYALRLQVIRADQTVDTAILQVTVDNTAPYVRILSPLPEQTFTLKPRQSITLLAEAEDTGGIARVEWWLDGQKIGESRVAPFSLPWQAGEGQHTLLVRAFDAAGNMGETSLITFRVSR